MALTRAVASKPDPVEEEEEESEAEEEEEEEVEEEDEVQEEEVEEDENEEENKEDEVPVATHVLKTGVSGESVLVLASPPKRSSKKRVWRGDDEIRLLKALLDFMEDTHAYPTPSDLQGLYSDMKTSLPPNVSETSFREKVRRLKRKFKKICPEKGFSNSHEQALYDLAVKIWGSGLGSAAASIPHRTPKKKEKKAKEEAKAASIPHRTPEKKAKEKAKAASIPPNAPYIHSLCEEENKEDEDLCEDPNKKKRKQELPPPTDSQSESEAEAAPVAKAASKKKKAKEEPKAASKKKKAKEEAKAASIPHRTPKKKNAKEEAKAASISHQKSKAKEEAKAASISLTESIRFDKELGAAGMGEEAWRQCLESLDPSSRKEFDEKWENLLMEEMKLTARRLGLMQEQTEAFLRVRNQ